MSAPEAQVEVPDTATKVVSNVLGAVGLNPFASPDPSEPVPDSPVMWAMLAMARKQEDVPEPSSFGRMFPDLEPLNQQTTEELKEIAQGMEDRGSWSRPSTTPRAPRRASRSSASSSTMI